MSQYFPALQTVHSEEAVRPVVAEYVPAGHWFCEADELPSGQ